MMDLKYQGTKIEKTNTGKTTTVVYYGTKEEMIKLEAESEIGSASNDGILRSVSVSQDEGTIWNCELRYEKTVEYAQIDNPDDYAYGQKSARLSCGIMSVPLEANPNYRTCWNYFLAALNGEKVPSWWASATDCCGIDSQRFRWIKTPAELPTELKNGRGWMILKAPTMPGVETYDLATYQITESMKFRKPKQAAAAVVGKLNKIVDPAERFGIMPGIWKCDSAEVSWTGEYWLATLTYTSSGDRQGWNKKLYDPGW